MAIVTFKIAGRPYKIACNDGQEAHIQELANFLDAKALALMDKVGFIPEGQLLSMVCILVAEELFSGGKPVTVTPRGEAPDLTGASQIIESLAIRVSELADVLKKGA